MLPSGRCSTEGALETPPIRHWPAGLAVDLIDSDSMGLTLLLMDLQAALAYLYGKDAPEDATTFIMIQRHARRTYDEAVSLLDSLSTSDRNRRYLEAQIAVLKTRLMLLGQKF